LVWRERDGEGAGMHISCDFNVSPLALPALGEHPVERERARERESERAREREREREGERERDSVCHHVAVPLDGGQE